MKILSIDFDIIMAPSIEIYNSLAGGASPIGEVLEQDIPLLRYADADLTAYQTLTNFLIAAASDMHPSNFHFIMNHADVIKCIPENESIDLMNIDHHHDLGYPNNGLQLNCGNWVDYLFQNDLIKGYTWIKNFNSSSLPEQYENHMLIQEIEFNDVDMIYELIKPDKIIICGSFEWIPNQFRPLFFLWRDIISRAYKQEFSIMRHEVPFENK